MIRHTVDRPSDQLPGHLRDRARARRLLGCALLAAWALLADALSVQAAPRAYAIDPAETEIGFRYTLGGVETGGTMPLASATLLIDFQRLENTSVTVMLDPSRATTTLPLAASALKSPSVLDTARHPIIRFSSDRVRPDGAGAVMTGQLTIRGITLPVSLRARFFRLPDRAPEDLRSLVIVLDGRVSRSAFGASGYQDLVADPVDLRIQATIRRID